MGIHHCRPDCEVIIDILFLVEYFWRDTSTMPDIKLEYFNAYGRAEIIRWILKVAGVEFEDHRYARKDDADFSKTWTAAKPKTPFGQTPVVHFDGKSYCQSLAIARYFANKHGLGGETDEDRAMCDQIIDCTMDMVAPRVAVWKCEDPTKKAELLKKWEEEQVPKFLAYFDRMLKANEKKIRMVCR